MAVPRNRHSNARKNSKRAHHAKKEKHVSTCTNCGKMHLPHRMCPFCGYYGGRSVISEAEAE
ncbi:MAG: 50S ribosomal protein L32 [Chlamydiia bacterium]|nr:50S ribosomal protein L32 [Chlamydiia bacterium]MCB1115965.1 50S ribosomal protein L32 [Chlamydiia bacterium]